MRLSANFVMTLDGKIQGPGPGYWPIGSEADLRLLLQLRAESDVLIHGRMTALGHDHVGRLKSAGFKALLQEQQRQTPYNYLVLSAHPDELLIKQIDPKDSGLRTILVTTEGAESGAGVPEGIEIWRLGETEVDLPALNERMQAQGWERAALEAGPKLFGAYVTAGLVDDLYLTLAPKLFGTAFGTPTLINGVLFSPEEVPRLELVTYVASGDELHLHYRFKRDV